MLNLTQSQKKKQKKQNWFHGVSNPIKHSRKCLTEYARKLGNVQKDLISLFWMSNRRIFQNHALINGVGITTLINGLSRIQEYSLIETDKILDLQWCPGHTWIDNQGYVWYNEVDLGHCLLLLKNSFFVNHQTNKSANNSYSSPHSTHCDLQR